MHCRLLSTLPSGCDNQRCLQALPNIPWCAKPPRSRTSGLGVELSADAVVPGAQVGSASRRPTSRPQTRPFPPGPPPQPNGPYCLNRFSTATKPVCFGGRKTSLGSLRPLPSLRPVPGGQEALPAPRGHSAPPPLPLPDSLLASCMRVPLTVSEGQASAPLLSASRQLREELATRNQRKGETWAWSRTTPFGGHATRRRQSRDSAEASGLPFRVPSLCHGAQRSVNPTRCKNYQGRAWAGAGGRGIRTAAVGAPGALLRRGGGGARHEGVTEVRRLLERAGRQPRERDMALRPLEGTAPD